VAFLNFKFEFLMLVALAISHLLMLAALTLLDYHYYAYGLSGTLIKITLRQNLYLMLEF
jgi:hypothetical protein